MQQSTTNHYIVVSTVYGETTCAVTAIFPCYERCSNNLKFLKAGVITLEELATPLMLFLHGGLINPYVLGTLHEHRSNCGQRHHDRKTI